ncbi:MAG: class I SAM-dependent methyltransferase [Betaproteobacteria bacterium]|nr:class I SAM-dependent methyltransferase [Betaproteobacteria bacterium]
MRSAILLPGILALALVAPAANAQEGQGDVVYVPTPQVVVDEMLRMAKVGPGDYVIDLGSGDGRIVITAAKKHGARGFGVDLDTYLLKLANSTAKKEGVAERAHFIEQNLFETDLSPATVVTSYLLPEMNEKLRPKLLTLKPGTRVVAHDYALGEWDPDEERTLLVPEKVVGDPGKSYIFLYVVPARVAGRWESEIAPGGKPVPYQFSFEQNFQYVHGTARVGGRELRLPQFRLAGEQIGFSLAVPAPGGPVAHRFSGRVKGDTIEGTVTVGVGSGQRVMPWKARQTARGEMKTGGAAGTRILAGGRR